jgi:hypothetical protein
MPQSILTDDGLQPLGLHCTYEAPTFISSGLW